MPSQNSSPPKLFFSGLDKPLLFDILVRQQGAAGMLNALSATKPTVNRACVSHPDLPLMLDSGAYQGNRNLERYAALIRKVGHRMDTIVTLDVLHNQSATDANFAQLCALLSDQKPLLDKLLYVYQAQSHGAHWCRTGDLEALRWAASAHHFLGIGGLVPLIKRNLQEALDLVGAIGEVLEASGAQAHLFGVGNYSILGAVCREPWFRSADSSRWLIGLSSRWLLTCDGKSFSAKNLAFSGVQLAEQNVRAMLSWVKAERVHQLHLFPDDDEQEIALSDQVEPPPISLRLA